jgi:hypothetical protein
LRCPKVLLKRIYFGLKTGQGKEDADFLTKLLFTIMKLKGKCTLILAKLQRDIHGKPFILFISHLTFRRYSIRITLPNTNIPPPSIIYRKKDCLSISHVSI